MLIFSIRSVTNRNLPDKRKVGDKATCHLSALAINEVRYQQTAKPQAEVAGFAGNEEFLEFLCSDGSSQ